MTGSRISTIIGLLVFGLACVFAPSEAIADEDGAVLTLVVPPDAVDVVEGNEAFHADTLSNIAEEAAKRVRKRLDAAKVKHWDVVVDGNRIRVSVYSSFSRQRLASILVPDGKMTIRPVLSAGDRWLSKTGSLPEGVRLEQPGNSMRADDAYLWATSRRQLSRVLEDHPLPGLELAMYPSKNGWRSVAMGAPVADEESVQRADFVHSSTGGYYVRVHLNAASAPEKSNRYGGESRWAMLLDGEIVRVWRISGAQLDTTLHLSPPTHLSSKAARKMWCQQVAGRLAAQIPVPLVEVDNVDED